MSGIGGSLENLFDPGDLVHNQDHRSLHNFFANQLDPGNISGYNRDAYEHGGSVFAKGVAPPKIGAPIIPGQGVASALGGASSNGGQQPFTPFPSMTPGAAGQGDPTMQGYGFTYYGGQAPVPEGGYFNQMAQAMAGPSYAPPGTVWNVLPPMGATGQSAAQAPTAPSVPQVPQAPQLPQLPQSPTPSLAPQLPLIDPTTGLPILGMRNPKLIAQSLGAPNSGRPRGFF